MKLLHLPFTIYRLPLIDHLSFSIAASLPDLSSFVVLRRMDRSRSYFGRVGKIDNCKLIIATKGGV